MEWNERSSDSQKGKERKEKEKKTSMIGSPFHYLFQCIYYCSPLSIDLINSSLEYSEEVHPGIEETSRVKSSRSQGIRVVIT
jgi:hypothetical protein